MPPFEVSDWVALNLIGCLGPLARTRGLQRFGSPSELAFRLPAEALATLNRRPPRDFADRLREARRGLRRRVAGELDRCRRAGIRVVPLDAPGYPALLREIADPPAVVYVSGALPEDRVGVAVVGSRRATAYGRRIATGLGSGLAEAGAEVVSGGARGVDAAAHRGALESRGRTIAVLGSGMLTPYPREHADLFREIAERGAVISEFALDEPPRRENFPRRNRLIAGLSAAVVVVEAAERSGSLSTAAHALDQGREVLAIPGPVTSDRSVGCNRLIQGGAKLVQNVEDVLDELPPPYRNRLTPKEDRSRDGTPPDLSDLTPDERLVLDTLDTMEPVQLDNLAERIPLGVARLQTALFGLELRGLVEHLPGRYYCSQLRRER